ncbi:MAG: ribosome biogenesis GTPase Der [Legionellales bacterium]|nr:ribosome biogenesis GTPase Der [Legionellales bacterium]
MLPVVAIVGAPNVGKSTLFNRFTKTRDALVGDIAGVTRDRQYGKVRVDNDEFIVIDTGGLGLDEDELELKRAEQAQKAIDEADIVLFMVDGRGGLTSVDQSIYQELRRLTKPVLLVMNKMDGVDLNSAQADFYRLGFKTLFPISSSQGAGIADLLSAICQLLPQSTLTAAESLEEGIRLAVVGRPNVGKSTLINRMLGEERVVVYDKPGTTMDSIEIPFRHFDQDYTLIDTAGVRRKSRVHQGLEKFSIVKTLQSIEHAHVVCYVINARDGISDQDLHLLGFIVNAGKALVIAINKWDGMEADAKQHVKDELHRRLPFINYARQFFISALHGSAVGELYPAIQEAYRSAMRKLSTPELTRLLAEALQAHQPPLIRGRRIKLKYAHAGGRNPPLIIIHGNQAQQVPDAFRRYLINFFRDKLRLIGTPLRLEFRSNENPYEGKKNELTERQLQKRKRLKKYIQKKKR